VIESPESSSPIVTRSVAAGLHNEYCNIYPLPGWQRIILEILGRLPQEATRIAIHRFEALAGIDPTSVASITVEDLAMERLNDYMGMEGPFPVVVAGSALGGASAHLALMLGGPFLPQAFVVTLRGGAPRGDVKQYLKLSADLALNIARRNPSLVTIQHFDPVHDGWLTRSVNHLRFKLIDLPNSYRTFLKRALAKDGAIVYLDCRAQWLRYRLDERSFFQVGGWGAISAQEYLTGSDRLDLFARSAGLQSHAWALADYPLDRGPESEWGNEAGLGEALQIFCQENGYRFIPISLLEPHDFSRLAFRAAAQTLAQAGLEPEGVVIEMFTQFDATAVQRSNLLPIWLVFNTRDSLLFLEDMRDNFPPGKPVFFSPLATFSLTPDMAPWRDWELALAGLDWRNIGTRPDHYPADALTLIHWADPLREWVAGHPASGRSSLSAEQLQRLAV
jgi:hypothetical protein